ncbi:MAG: hypothetical protein KDD33_01040 [Bdellovibrionales bacterium]|nr:hypothetical protein [Bdellovibrionales bacterium]
MQKSAIFAGLMVLVFIVGGCEDDKKSKLFKTQVCINQSTPATVAGCSSLLGNTTGKQAAALRCSIKFIEAGVTESQIITALENIDDQNAGQDPTSAAVNSIKMNTVADSTEARQYCDESESEALIALSYIAHMATIMSIGLASLNSDLEAAIASFDPNSPPGDLDQAALGQTVIDSQQSLCDTKNGMLKDSEACGNINKAIECGAGDSSAVANAMIYFSKDGTSVTDACP